MRVITASNSSSRAQLLRSSVSDYHQALCQAPISPYIGPGMLQGNVGAGYRILDSSVKFAGKPGLPRLVREAAPPGASSKAKLFASRNGGAIEAITARVHFGLSWLLFHLKRMPVLLRLSAELLATQVAADLDRAQASLDRATIAMQQMAQTTAQLPGLLIAERAQLIVRAGAAVTLTVGVLRSRRRQPASMPESA